ncbi:hypothetical protein DY000_02022985 [Brassica cretica]|uniref:Uncharacterized protein n=1 Tax=Brassica cretica TaxID=69181 RepID=A0ABQ7E828_BRACR|nr:hypothetical protein DY000_02022985 [Brassica cretica]
MSKSRSVQFSPVKASIGFWPSPLRSTSCLSAKNTVSCDQLIADLFSSRFPLFRSWIMAGGQVALGKDDRIAWCWTLGPPV